jgi:hypothetical protein
MGTVRQHCNQIFVTFVTAFMFLAEQYNAKHAQVYVKTKDIKNIKSTPSTLNRKIRFQVLTAASMKMTVLWNVASCTMVKVRFRRACCLHHQGDEWRSASFKFPAVYGTRSNYNVYKSLPLEPVLKPDDSSLRPHFFKISFIRSIPPFPPASPERYTPFTLSD